MLSYLAYILNIPNYVSKNQFKKLSCAHLPIDYLNPNIDVDIGDNNDNSKEDDFFDFEPEKQSLAPREKVSFFKKIKKIMN